MTIKKYSKRPIEVRAIQFDGNNLVEIQSIVGKCWNIDSIEKGDWFVIENQAIRWIKNRDFGREFEEIKP